jgi:hypothetical protein
MTDQRIVSLFDVDDVASFGAVRDMTVTKVGRSDVAEFCRRWHYTATGGNMTWSYGLWDGFTLCGVVSYNLPTMETCSVVFGSEHWSSVIHMGRLVCADDAPRNVESRLIAGSLKSLDVDRPETRAVLTYAAQDQGHLGYVYQATNAIYTGEAGHTDYYRDAKGTRRSDYLGGAFVSKSRAADMGWTHVKGAPKHRYLYLLGNKTKRRESLSMLRLPSLPYPKEVSP